MTKRHRRLGLLPPKRNKTFSFYLGGLDSERLEIMPRFHRDAAADDPWLAPAKSDIVLECTWRIEKAASHTPLLVNGVGDNMLDLRGLCEDAKLSPPEVDVVVLACELWTQRQIAQWLGFSQATVSRRLSTGRHKLAGWLPLAVVYRLANA